MFAFILIPFYAFVPYLVAVLIAWWLTAWRAGDEESRRPLRLFAVEELVIGGFIWQVGGGGSSPGAGWSPPAFGLGFALLCLLRSPWRPADWLCPLTGDWRRRAEATLAVGGLLAGGPWWWLSTISWRLGTEGGWSGGYRSVYAVTAVALPVALLLFAALVWIWLAAGSPGAARRFAGEPSSGDPPSRPSG